MEVFEAYLLIIGIILCHIITLIIKNVIKQKRPNKCIGTICSTFGMPSGRATIVGFITTFLALSVKKNIYGIYLISFLALIPKYILYQHDLKQLFAGLCLGIFIAIVLYKSFSKQWK